MCLSRPSDVADSEKDNVSGGRSLPLVLWWCNYRSATNLLLLMDTFLHSPPKFFTFNDGFDDAVPASVRFAFRVFLRNWFSKPSQFEVADAPWY